MPVFNGSGFLEQSLRPLIEMLGRKEILEVIVVDDGSTDGSAKMAERLGARTLHTGGRLGPGAARNLAAEEAAGDIVWFVDADVIVHPDAADRICEDFSEPTVSAVFGSYDDRPTAENFLSQYKNLVHRFYHQHGKSDASTFWAGCGAVRTDHFREAGGFDTRRYTRPSIEDIEFGYRLCASGKRVLLNPSVQGTHLKHWTLFSLVHTDIVRRAIPWSRLMLENSGFIDDLNVSVGERLRAVLAGLFAFTCIAALLNLIDWWLFAGTLIAVFACNWKLARYFQRRKGTMFAVAAVLFHQIYYLYSSAAYVWAWFGHHFSRLLRR